ncbi:MAG TPA: hypothetical protein VMB78_06465 [Dissulfurispiraceae bacterium]|nr:hypothetical protein [Dissulfurispiraceae bacterium]
MKRNKKLMILAVPVIVVLLSLVFYQYAYQGVRSEKAALKEQRDARMNSLNKYVALIAEKPELEKQLAVLKEQENTQKAKLVEGEPISLASANLQGLVKGIVTGRGGTISSERIGKPEDLEKPVTPPGAAPAPASAKGAAGKKNEKSSEGQKLQVLSVSIDATLPDAAALSDILYSIETRSPYLIIKELDVRVRNFKDPKELMVRIDVTGLYGGK